MRRINPMTDFILHPRLAQDTIFITNLNLSKVLLMNDSRYSWLILVPQVDNITEIYDLSAEQQIEFIQEANIAARVIKDIFNIDKINIGSLGNIVAQMHMHVIGRRQGDAAWPGPVWGYGIAEPYIESQIQTVKSDILKAFNGIS